MQDIIGIFSNTPNYRDNTPPGLCDTTSDILGCYPDVKFKRNRRSEPFMLMINSTGARGNLILCQDGKNRSADEINRLRKAYGMEESVLQWFNENIMKV